MYLHPGGTPALVCVGLSVNQVCVPGGSTGTYSRVDQGQVQYIHWYWSPHASRYACELSVCGYGFG
jgi:hypothetical protein